MSEKINIQNIIDQQLKQYYSAILFERDNRIKVRNWVITIWLGYIALLGSGKFLINYDYPLIIFFLIIAFFWLHESLHESLITMLEIRVKQLEEFLSQKELPEHIPIDLFFVHGYSKQPYKSKIKFFFRAFFTCETIVSFYFAIALGSFLFLYFFKIHSPDMVKK